MLAHRFISGRNLSILLLSSPFSFSRFSFSRAPAPAQQYTYAKRAGLIATVLHA